MSLTSFFAFSSATNFETGFFCRDILTGPIKIVSITLDRKDINNLITLLKGCN